MYVISAWHHTRSVYLLLISSQASIQRWTLHTAEIVTRRATGQRQDGNLQIPLTCLMGLRVSTTVWIPCAASMGHTLPKKSVQSLYKV